jgi:putative flippase GtrA
MYYGGGVITADADGQHMIEDIVKVSNILENDEDSLVLGCREFDSKQVPFKSKFGNTLTRFVFKYLCGLSISDTQTGLRGIPKKLLPLSCQVEGERYEYETNVLLTFKLENINIREITINTLYENNNNESHFNPLRDSVKIYAVILKYMCSSILSVIIDYTVFFLVAYFTENIFVMTYSGRCCSSLVNFMTNKNIVFKSSGNGLLQLVKYMVLVLISGTVSAFAVSLLQSILGYNLLITKVIVELILFFVNFYIQRNVIFAKKDMSK